jgi:hypothetical protein
MIHCQTMVTSMADRTLVQGSHYVERFMISYSHIEIVSKKKCYYSIQRNKQREERFDISTRRSKEKGDSDKNRYYNFDFSQKAEKR